MNWTICLTLIVSLGVISMPAVRAQELKPASITGKAVPTASPSALTAPVRLKDTAGAPKTQHDIELSALPRQRPDHP